MNPLDSLAEYRIPAPNLSFTEPNLPALIREVESLSVNEVI